MFAQPVVPSTLLKGNTFLLNPLNAGFLDGSERKLHDFKWSNVGAFVFMMVMFGAFGGVFAYLGAREMIVRSQLNGQGVETSATVTAVDHTTSTSSKGGRTDNYYVTYLYDVTTGNNDFPTQYSYRQSITSDTYDRLFQGDTISVRYLASDPGTSRYLDDNEDNGILPTLFGLVFASVGVIIIIVGIRQKLRNNRLEADGQIIAGKIVEAKGRGSKSGFNVSIRYSLRSPEGNELSRKESRNRNDLRGFGLPAEGSPVAVLFVSDRLYRML